MTLFKSGAGYEGFPNKETEGLAYLYGLSDFWSIIFEDSDLVDHFLESTSIGLAGVYSKFLQLTSSISVNDVQTFLYEEVRLLVLRPSMKVDSVSGTTYSLPEDVEGCKYILDRPMLAINTLEENVHYFIDPSTSTITFHKPISELGLPTRTTPEGEIEVSMWMTDVTTDDSLVYKYFGELIGVSPQNVTRVYRDFIRGLYYLYTQGPTITLLERGLSLALGIPISRTDEKVLLTVKNQTTGNWIVATDKSSYSIPYGLEPEVQPGDELESGRELVKVAEVKDYLVEDEWWLNLSIPTELIPLLPDESQRVAYPGNLSDSIMRDYLKHHTFLVRIKWDKTFNATNFDEVFRILYDAKPSYTYPIFVWSVVDTEEINIIDDELEIQLPVELVDSFGCGGPYIQRNVQKINERSETCFIHGNRDPSNDDESLHVSSDLVVKKENIYPTSDLLFPALYPEGYGPDSISVNNTLLTPLYNATAVDLLHPSRFGNYNLPGELPKVFIVHNVPMSDTAFPMTITREPRDPSFSGVTRNTNPLDFNASMSHNVYSAFVPPLDQLNDKEHFLIMEVQSNLYSVFLLSEPSIPDPLNVTFEVDGYYGAYLTSFTDGNGVGPTWYSGGVEPPPFNVDPNAGGTSGTTYTLSEFETVVQNVAGEITPANLGVDVGDIVGYTWESDGESRAYQIISVDPIYAVGDDQENQIGAFNTYAEALDAIDNYSGTEGFLIIACMIGEVVVDDSGFIPVGTTGPIFLDASGGGELLLYVPPQYYFFFNKEA